MRSVSKKFPLSLTAVEKVVDVFRQCLCLIATKVKLPLRNNVVGIVAIIGNQCHLADVPCVSENNVTRTDKRVRQTASVFLSNEVVPKLIKIKPTQMVATDNGYAALDKGLDLDIRAKGTHSDFLCKVLDGLNAPPSRDFAKFAIYKFTVCEWLKVHKPRFIYGLSHLL